MVAPDNPAALAISRELGAAGVPVVLAHHHGDGPARHSKYTRLVRVPDLYTDTQAWAEALAQIARELRTEEGVKPFFFPTEDAALLAGNAHHNLLAEHFRFAYATPGVIDAIADKRSLYAAAERADVAVPAHQVITEPGEAAKLAGRDGWIVKPSCRYILDGKGIKTFLSITGGSKAIGGDPAEAARRVVEAGFPVLAQEEIPGPFSDLVSVGLAVGPGGEIIDAFHSRKDCEYPEPYGDGLIVELTADPGITKPTLALLGELGYWGICDVEFKRDARDGRFKLLDANPRAWLWMTLGTLSGHSLAVEALNAAIRAQGSGEQPAVPIQANAGFRRWVSARGTAGFLAKCYDRKRHGATLPARLAVGVATTAAANLAGFGDPTYASLEAWAALFRAARKQTGW